jgi:channel protein (hemolysin III family)
MPTSIPGFNDPVSSISHLLGAAVFFALSFPLLKLGRGNLWKTAALGVFCFASVLLLLVSGIYHLLSPEGEARIIFKHLDHSAIFVLIVATMTPIHQILFKGFMRWGWLIFIWVIAITTLTLKNVFFSSFPEWLGLSLFLGLGWLGVVTGGIVWYKQDFAFVKLLLYGGLAYTIGALLEFSKSPIIIPSIVGSHELFHITVLIGLAMHWKFIYGIAKSSDRFHSPFPKGEGVK